LNLLGGIMGQDLFLPEFLPIVLDYRSRWFPDLTDVVSCCDPAGTHDNSQGTPIKGVDILHEHGFYPRWRDDSNTVSNRRTAIETMVEYMRKIDLRGEPALQVHPDRWFVVSKESPRERPFLLQGFEAGYVWDPNQRSVGNRSVSMPKKDGWFEHAQNCLEYLILNFGKLHRSTEQIRKDEARRAASALRMAQRDHDEYDLSRRRPSRRGRGL